MDYQMHKLKVKEIYRWKDFSTHSNHGALRTFSFKLIMILHKSLSELSLVRAESTDFVLTSKMNGEIQNYRNSRVFLEFVFGRR